MYYARQNIPSFHSRRLFSFSFRKRRVDFRIKNRILLCKHDDYQPNFWRMNLQTLQGDYRNRDNGYWSHSGVKRSGYKLRLTRVYQLGELLEQLKYTSELLGQLKKCWSWEINLWLTSIISIGEEGVAILLVASFYWNRRFNFPYKA